jgi:hypothetical protein
MKKNNLYIGLLHYPVLNQHNKIITTSITNLDIHDLARLVATYNLGGYYLIQPLPKQRELFNELIDFWKKDRALKYNIHRSQAFRKIYIVSSLEECINNITTTEAKPKIIVTGARLVSNISYTQVRKMKDKETMLLLFGTGWGLADDVINKADYQLEPIKGEGSYNHLSVRSAASIIIDRICSKKWW